MWFDAECINLLNEYASWANEFISHRPIYDIIACRFSREGVTVLEHELTSMNHWVAAIEYGVHAETTIEGTLLTEQSPEARAQRRDKAAARG